MPIGLLLGQPEKFDTCPDEDVEKQKQKIEYAYAYVREFTGNYVQRQREQNDLRVQEKSFNIGDWVWYLYPRRQTGRSPKWSCVYT